jgi:hypothetical protein
VPPCVPLTEEGSPTASNRSSIRSHDEAIDEPAFDVDEAQDQNDGADDDGFGDFDEFEEGGEGDDDFGDFDDGFQQGEEPAETSFDKPPDQPPVPAPSPGLVSLNNTSPAHAALPCCPCVMRD